VPEQIQNIISNLQDFGPRRLSTMAGVAALVLAIIGVASVCLNRPAYETLYVGLERSDVDQIGLVLGEAGIGFDVAADGTTVPVPEGEQAAHAAPVSALPGGRAQNPLDDLRQKIRPARQERLARMVDLNEERTAQILRIWAHQEAVG
jgi:flagellar biosynthesis/type III secretory pathway M-ring protein FliF/YscJ